MLSNMLTVLAYGTFLKGQSAMLSQVYQALTSLFQTSSAVILRPNVNTIRFGQLNSNVISILPPKGHYIFSLDIYSICHLCYTSICRLCYTSILQQQAHVRRRNESFSQPRTYTLNSLYILKSESDVGEVMLKWQTVVYPEICALKIWIWLMLAQLHCQFAIGSWRLRQARSSGT